MIILLELNWYENKTVLVNSAESSMFEISHSCSELIEAMYIFGGIIISISHDRKQLFCVIKFMSQLYSTEDKVHDF